MDNDADSILATLPIPACGGRPGSSAPTRGSTAAAPRGIGAKMAVSSGGSMAGSVSGGCIEGAVIDAAAQVMASGRPQLLEFGVSDEQAWQVGLACGGRVQVFVEPVE